MNTDNIKKIIEKTMVKLLRRKLINKVLTHGILCIWLERVSLRYYANIFGISERIESILEVLDYEI